jgi:hypothetical protein
VGEDGLHGEGILHGSDDAQAAPAARAGEDIKSEHAAHQRGPGPRVRGTGGGGTGLERARGGVEAARLSRTTCERQRACGARTP